MLAFLHWCLEKFYPANGNLGTQDYNWQLSNEVLYANLPQGALKLPEFNDLDLCNLLNKRGLFGNF